MAKEFAVEAHEPVRSTWEVVIALGAVRTVEVDKMIRVKERFLVGNVYFSLN